MPPTAMVTLLGLKKLLPTLTAAVAGADVALVAKITVSGVGSVAAIA